MEQAPLSFLDQVVFGFVYYAFLSFLTTATPKYFMEMMFPMSNRQKRRSDQQWLALFQECRTSGMTDKDWCEMNGISASSFYNKISKLRKKNYDILTVAKTPSRSMQEVVPLEIVDEPQDSLTKHHSDQCYKAEFVPTVVIHTNELTIELSNGAANDTILSVLLAVKQLC